jgi:hypothetical protein
MVLVFSVIAFPLGAQTDSVRTHALLGCYQLRIDGSPDVAPSPRAFRLNVERPDDWLPTLQRIATAMRHETPGRPPFDSSTAFGPWLRALPDPWVSSTSSLFGTAWRLSNADTLEITWSDGHSPINLLLRIAHDTLRGTAHYGSDQVGHGRTLAARAWRTSCRSFIG